MDPFPSRDGSFAHVIVGIILRRQNGGQRGSRGRSEMAEGTERNPAPRRVRVLEVPRMNELRQDGRCPLAEGLQQLLAIAEDPIVVSAAQLFTDAAHHQPQVVAIQGGEVVPVFLLERELPGIPVAEAFFDPPGGTSRRESLPHGDRRPSSR
jgi:hypothetical protein